MKKTIVLLALLLILALTVTACGKKPVAADNTANSSNSSENAATTAEADGENDEVSYGVDNEYVVFTASLDFEFEDSSAWLGIIPTGTKYEKEADADEVDMLYCYAANFDDDSKESYRFEIEKEYFFSLGDGTYDLILTSSDDAEIGKVLLQIGIEINGEEITLDFENKK